MARSFRRDCRVLLFFTTIKLSIRVSRSLNTMSCGSGSLVQFPLEDEYKKDTGITPKDVSELREWLKSQPHLPESHITDLDLILVYHCCDRDMEKSKQLIDTHYTLKTSLTLLFKDLVFDAKIEKVLNIILLQHLPKRTKEGYAIFYSRILDTDPQKFVHLDALRAVTMAWEIWQYEEGTWPGLVFVSDLAGFGFGHFYRTHWSATQQNAKFMQEAFLGKLKRIHMLNAPSIFDKMLTMCKPFVNKDLLDIIHIHRVGATAEDLNQYFPVEALPLEAGGSWKSVEQCKEETLAKFRASSDFFKTESMKRVDEAKRPVKARTGYFSSFF